MKLHLLFVVIIDLAIVIVIAMLTNVVNLILFVMIIDLAIIMNEIIPSKILLFWLQFRSSFDLLLFNVSYC